MCSFFQAGDIHYCRSRGKTKCCFTNEKCEESWKSIYDNVSIEMDQVGLTLALRLVAFL